MKTPHYQDEQVTLWHGDAASVLRELPAGSVDCIVTSPPYFGLRDYGVDGQIGAEASPAEFVSALVAVFREARRVLAKDGTVWLNLGDSYGHGKQLLGIPWRVALALQDDGWTLRNEVIWHKPNAMPESVTDRLSYKHEHVFLLTKGQRYHFDLDAIREPHEFAIAGSKGPGGGWADDQSRGSAATGKAHRYGNAGGKNPGDVWALTPDRFPGAHFATMPRALAERCIQAACKPGGTVLDPFSGSGTTGLAAARHGRRYVGIDLNAEYLDLSLRTRLRDRTLDFGEATA
jgi:DNA modification methylase